MDVEDTLSPFEIAFAGDSVPAAATSPRFELLLRGSAPPALRAQRLLAALSLLAFDACPQLASCSRRRSGGIPTSRRTARSSPACRATRSITAVTLDTLFESVPAATGDDRACRTRTRADHSGTVPDHRLGIRRRQRRTVGLAQHRRRARPRRLPAANARSTSRSAARTRRLRRRPISTSSTTRSTRSTPPSSRLNGASR